MPRHYRYRPDRPTRAQRVAWCDRCEGEKGVTVTPWNNGDRPKAVPKFAVHKLPDGSRRCPNSSLTVHPNTVFEREPAS